jgi:hypothetical protein
MATKEQIAANAELVIEQVGKLLGVSLDYDEKSLEWLDGYIDRNRKNFDEEMKDKLVSVFGSFLGECVCRNYDGEWIEDNGQWAVRVGEEPNQIIAFPLGKARKLFENSLEGGDSIAGFYRVLPYLFNHSNSFSHNDSELSDS